MGPFPPIIPGLGAREGMSRGTRDPVPAPSTFCSPRCLGKHPSLLPQGCQAKGCATAQQDAVGGKTGEGASRGKGQLAPLWVPGLLAAL